MQLDLRSRGLMKAAPLPVRLSQGYGRLASIMATAIPLLRSILFVAIAVLACVARAQPAVTYQTVALTGQPALGPAVAAYYESFFYMWLGDGGHVAFSGSINSLGNQTLGAWAGRPGEIANLMHGGALAPGVDAEVYFSNLYPFVNTAGELAFSGNIHPRVGYLRDQVLWTGPPENLQVAVREGDHAPGTEPTTVFTDTATGTSSSTFEDVHFDNAGQISFIGLLNGPGVPRFQRGLWSGFPNDIRLVMRQDTQASGLPQGVTYGAPFEYDQRGSTFAFKSFLRGGRVNQLTDVGVWLGTPDNLQLVAREGDLISGRRSVAIAQLNFGDPVQIDALGRALFPASLVGRGVNSGNDFGYWISGPQGPELLFSEGDPVPAVPGAYFSELIVRLGPENEYGIIARLRGASISDRNDSALFLGTPGNLKLVAREGQPAPGTPSGILLGDFFDAWRTTVTPSGQFAFANVLSGSGITSANDVAYFATDSHQNMFLVAREGDSLDVGGGNIKRITNLDNGVFGPSEATFNSRGELFFEADFADGEGLFVAKLGVQPIPEPSTYALAGVLIAIVLGVIGLRWLRSSKSLTNTLLH